MRVWAMSVAAAVLSVLPVAADPAPRCAGEIEIGDVHIMRVEHNGVLVMTDGRALKLEGIRLLGSPQDKGPHQIADTAFAALNELAKGRQVDAHAVYPKEDRYDRIRGQIFTSGGTWLQIELLKRGLARVDISPDRGECYADLYAAEAEARRAGTGLWADPAYASRTPGQVAGDIGSFQTVVGRVADAAAVNGGVNLNFGQDWQRDFTVIIAQDDLKTFRRMGVDPMNYQGKLIRVRGIVQSLNGPAITVGNPKQIELLQ